jgi:hypothetical protein
VTWETVLTDKIGGQSPTELTVRSPAGAAEPGAQQTLGPERTISVLFRPLPQLEIAFFTIRKFFIVFSYLFSKKYSFSKKERKAV